MPEQSKELPHSNPLKAEVAQPATKIQKHEAFKKRYQTKMAKLKTQVHAKAKVRIADKAEEDKKTLPQPQNP